MRTPNDSVYDLVLDTGGTPIGLMLRAQKNRDGTPQPKDVPSALTAAAADSLIETRDVPAISGSNLRGAGYSQELEDDESAGAGSSYGYCIDDRHPWGTMPSGQITELPLPGGAFNATTAAIIDFTTFAGHVWGLTNGPAILRIGGGDPYGVAAPLVDSSFTTLRGATRRGVSFTKAKDAAGISCLWVGTDDGTVAGGSLFRRAVTGVFGSTVGTDYSDILVKPRRTVWWTDDRGVGAYRMVGNTTPYQLCYSVGGDPLVLANWQTGIDIGTPEYPILGMTSSGEHVWTSKADGLYDTGELGHSPVLNSYANDQIMDGNGIAVKYHAGAVYWSYGQTLDKINVSTAGAEQSEPGVCGPGFGLPCEAIPMIGFVTALTVDQGWIVAATWNSDYQIACTWYGRPARSGPSPIIWHGAMTVLEGSRITAMYPSSQYVDPTGRRQNHLFIATTQIVNATTRLFTQALPTSGSPLSALFSLSTAFHKFYNGIGPTNTLAAGLSRPSRQFQTVRRFGDSNARTFIRQVAVRADNVSAVNTLKVYARTDPNPLLYPEPMAGAGFTQVGATIPTAGASPEETAAKIAAGTVKRITRVPTNAEAPVGTSQQLCVEWGVPATGASAAILRSTRMRGAKIVDAYRNFTLDVEYGYGTPLRTGGADDRNAEDVTAALIATTSLGLLTLYDWLGGSRQVHVEQVLDVSDTLEEDGRQATRAKLQLSVAPTQ